jgi:RNA polymerase sigma factor (sigma-70 family)
MAMRRSIAPDDPRCLLRAWQLLVITAAAENLHPRQREILDLVIMGGLTLAQVATQLQIPPNTVLSRVQGALAGLRRAIRNDDTLRALYESAIEELASRN